MYPGLQPRDILTEDLGLDHMPLVPRLEVEGGMIIYGFQYVVDGGVPTLSHRSVPLTWHPNPS